MIRSIDPLLFPAYIWRRRASCGERCMVSRSEDRIKLFRHQIDKLDGVSERCSSIKN